MSSRPTIFLDKDGTLVTDVPYNVRPERIELAAGAAAGLRPLVHAGYQLIVVSNQSGVARAFFEERALAAVERRIRQLLASAGIPLAGFYYCPHHPQGTVPRYAMDCDCRKPKPGLLVRATRDLHVAIETSWMIGDILDDIEAAHRAGCRAVLLLSGGETKWQLSRLRMPDAVAVDLPQAAGRIMERSPLRGRPPRLLAADA